MSSLAGSYAFPVADVVGSFDEHHHLLTFFASSTSATCEKIDPSRADWGTGYLIGRIESPTSLQVGTYPLTSFGPWAKTGTLASIGYRSDKTRAFDIASPTEGELRVDRITSSEVVVAAEFAFADGGRTAGILRVRLCPQ